MEDMNLGMDTATTIVEEVITKPTFKENCLAYGLTGVFVTGVITIGYLGFKGGRKLGKKFMKKKVSNNESENVKDVESENVHEVNDESEQG